MDHIKIHRQHVEKISIVSDKKGIKAEMHLIDNFLGK